MALHAGTRRWRSLDRETVKILRQSLQAKSATDPDFWSVVGETELDQYEALAQQEARAGPQAAGEGLRGSAQARDGDPDVGVGVRHGVSGVAELRQSRDRQGETAANELLAQLRTFAHPDEDQ